MRLQGRSDQSHLSFALHDAVLVHPVQAAMDSPLEACSIYLQHYEPYLKDPVGFPRVMVTAAFSSSPIVSARSVSWLLTDSFSNKQLTAGTQRAASLTSLLRCLSVRLIEKPFFIITAAMSRSPTVRRTFCPSFT